MRSSLFWDVTQCRLVVTNVSGQLTAPIFKGQAVKDHGKMGPISCPETSVTTNLHCVTSQKSEDVICNRGGSLKSRTSINQLSQGAGFQLYVENDAGV